MSFPKYLFTFHSTSLCTAWNCLWLDENSQQSQIFFLWFLDTEDLDYEVAFAMAHRSHLGESRQNCDWDFQKDAAPINSMGSAPWIPLKVPAHGLLQWLWSRPICLCRNTIQQMEQAFTTNLKKEKKKQNDTEGESIKIFPEGIKRHYQNHSLLKPKSGNWTVFLINPVMVMLGEISMLHGYWSSSGMRKQEIRIAVPMTYHSCVEAGKCWNYFELF